MFQVPHFRETERERERVNRIVHVESLEVCLTCWAFRLSCKTAAKSVCFQGRLWLRPTTSGRPTSPGPRLHGSTPGQYLSVGAEVVQIYNFASKSSLTEAVTLKAGSGGTRTVYRAGIWPQSAADVVRGVWGRTCFPCKICHAVMLQSSISTTLFSISTQQAGPFWRLRLHEDHGDAVMGVCFSQHARSLATVSLGANRNRREVGIQSKAPHEDS